MRRAARTDSNHAAIVKALRDLGCSVLDLSGLGQKGVPDILVGCAGMERLCEIKPVGKRPCKTQVDWCAAWRGRRPVLLQTEADALTLVLYLAGRMRPWRDDEAPAHS